VKRLVLYGWIAALVVAGSALANGAGGVTGPAF
jgi:hypothetical protein